MVRLFLAVVCVCLIGMFFPQSINACDTACDPACVQAASCADGVCAAPLVGRPVLRVVSAPVRAVWRLHVNAVERRVDRRVARRTARCW